MDSRIDRVYLYSCKAWPLNHPESESLSLLNDHVDHDRRSKRADPALAVPAPGAKFTCRDSRVVPGSKKASNRSIEIVR